ncbi:hypothetical protein CC80DRAFT_484839 [Byssothecium circinans]|uniref:Uncharacterized protein n=1 Tax=Byssothecium circinans TaxID=147558 RepID=A0A6A5TC21_9PLEO|nr:hypothetical protein CC80DRAFT_484839 [Byssothecium circinans]
MQSLLLSTLLLLSTTTTFAAPVPNDHVTAAAAATVGKIRGVAAPIYHLYLQANPKNASIPVLGPEASADDFTIGSTIQSKKTGQYLNIETASTSYKPLSWGASAATTAWGLEGDTIITVTGSSYGRREYFSTLHSTSCLFRGGNLRR